MNEATMRNIPIAVIGQAGIFAKAANVREYWNNILDKVDCITEVPSSRWNVEDYYDPDPAAPDKTYCKRGGFVPDIDFDPLEFGMPPNTLEVTDVSQLLGLVVARDVMEDAGYGTDDEFDRDQVGVVLGVSGGLKLLKPLSARLQYPVWEKVLRSSGLSEEDTRRITEKMKKAYVEWNENAFPGLLGNVIAGRIANRLNLGGINSTIDAACASSLAAVQVAISQLVERRADMMITGGVDTDNSPFTFMCFSKTPAFSKRGEIRPFDAEADGMLAGEGIGMVLLKRLEDAERDGDRIYGVIRGIGASSDGRYKSIYAPRPEGQAKAIRRAYEEAGFAPETVGLVEAHGTGTMAGDPAEMAGLRLVFDGSNGRGQHIALGSIKSQIGHTKGAAGAASLVKTVLALDHKVLPPTLNVETPNPKLELETSPFYVNTELRPWIRAEGALPRRAGISAFGFGGTNFHVVLEEYTADHADAYRMNRVAQPVILHAATPEDLTQMGEATLEALNGADADAAYAELTAGSRASEIPQSAARLGFVADDRTQAVQLLEGAVAILKKQPEAETWEHPRGITYRRSGIDPDGAVVALFPGQGSQYLNMGREVTINFPPLRETYAQMDARFIDHGLTPLSDVVFPIPAFDDETRKAQSAALRATDYAQAAIGVTSAGLFKILAQVGFAPDFTAGHSFGELSALWAGGVLSDDAFLDLVKARGKAMSPPDDPEFTDAGTMLAVKGALAKIEQEVANFDDVVIANQNSRSQVVLAGPTAAIEAAAEVLGQKEFKVTPLPVSAAFHTPLVGHASEPFAAAVEKTTFQKAQIPVYSNTTGEPYPEDAEAAKEILANHILHPVIFKTQIEQIYEAGGRIFVEVGPRRIVTNLVIDILEGKPHVAVPLNASRKKSSDRQLRDAVVRLQVAGIPLGDIDPYAQ
jgi:polyketide-type polyunsaturated fatty acid synthase PfaA